MRRPALGVRSCLLFLSLLQGSAAAQERRQAAAHPSDERAVLNRHCVACHNGTLKTGGLALDAISVERPEEHPEVWERVVRKLRARHMPPPGMPRPDERAYRALIGSLEAALDKAAAAAPDPGRGETFHRLNRTEYRNVIRDVLDLDVDVEALLPADEPSHGFDNLTAGDLTPTLLERYLDAARKVSRRAVGSPIAAPGGDLVQLPPDLTQEEHIEGLPPGTRGGTGLRYAFPLDAEYEIQLRLARDRNEHVEGLRDAHEVELLIDGEPAGSFTVKPPASPADHQSADRHLRVRVRVTAGPHRLAVVFPKRRSALLETERQPYQAHFNMDRHPRIQPALHSISINGPYDASGPGDTPSRRRIFVCRPKSAGQEDACARRILSTLMRRAYRRPVGGAELAAPLRFYGDARRSGSFEDGIELALRAVLVSPEFLFRVERDPPEIAPNTAYRVTDLELASRLSFFLWSSCPDDELLDLAARGKLGAPAMLERQVRRMLADAKSQALVTSFADQWLQLRSLASITPDMRLFPDFDDNLRQAFRRETELFFESILREDRSVLDLLRADYTFLNERLAKHYGIPGVYGSRFRRVSFAADGARGGLLRHGSFLTVSSYATRTSPVLRGKWVLQNLIGIPPPPPLPAVPALPENRETGKKLTMRERLARHRADPACSGCHRLMDPIGFALENYDAVGRHRATEDDAPIDATGGLPDGSSFEGVAGVQQALLGRPDVFMTTFTEKLMTYALGRGLEHYDAPAVRKVVRRAEAEQHRFSSVVLGIVDTVPFRMRRSQ
jgi:mono/diheme cytochrome c family protein